MGRLWCSQSQPVAQLPPPLHKQKACPIALAGIRRLREMMAAEGEMNAHCPPATIHLPPMLTCQALQPVGEGHTRRGGLPSLLIDREASAAKLGGVWVGIMLSSLPQTHIVALLLPPKLPSSQSHPVAPLKFPSFSRVRDCARQLPTHWPTGGKP